MNEIKILIKFCQNTVNIYQSEQFILKKTPSCVYLLTFVSVHLTAVGDERHLLRPAHVFVPYY